MVLLCESVEASEIRPLLWQGSRPRVGSFVSDAGFDILVLSADEYQPSADQFPGVLVYHVPYDDSLGVTEEELGRATKAGHWVARQVRAGRSVLTTCIEGRNRSGLINAIAVRELTKCSGEQAANVIRLRRKNALTNDVFLHYLKALPTKK